MKLFTTIAAKNANLSKMAVIGSVLLAISALVIVNDPVQMVVDTQLALRPGSLLYNLWLKPPLEVFITVYMFNVTNMDAYMRGIDAKLKLSEVGPYVYQEILENQNVTFNANNTVTYKPKRTIKFIRERSVGDPKVDRVIAPNIPYMGVTSAASSFSGFAAIAVRALTNRLNSQAMLEMSVHDYLWGYEDHLVHLASRFIPSVVTFQRFGLLERMFDEGDNLVTMKLPENNADPAAERKEGVLRDFAIDKWNGKTGIKFWGYKENENNTNCNRIRGAHDGTLFPRHISKGETFRIYRKAFCRTLPIVYTHPGVYDGIEGYNFKLSENAFDSDLDDPDTACFCKNNKCLKKGLGNVTPCYYNIPLAISFPHFYHADPSLLDNLEGLKPDEAKHGTQIVIQPQLGIPMKVHSRFQANLIMGDIKFNSEMARFRNTVLPILWLDIGVEKLTPGLMLLLRLLFQICPYVQVVAILVMMVSGVSFIATAILLRFWLPKLNAAMDRSHMHHSLDVQRMTNMTNICLRPLLKQESKLGQRLQNVKLTEYDVTLLPLQKCVKKGFVV